LSGLNGTKEEKGADELKQEEIECELQHESESCNKELDFEKCLYSQQELRTILVLQRETDGYLLRQDLDSEPLFEFYDK